MSSPAATPVVNNLIRITLDTLTENQHCQNVLDYINGTLVTITSGQLQAAITDWETAFLADYLACLSPKTEMFAVTAQELHFGTVPSQVHLFTPGASPGTAGATNNPLEVAATISRQADLKGKHGRGRISMPAVPNTFITPATAGSLLNAAGIAAYNGFAFDLSLAFVSGAFTWLPVISTRPIPPSTAVIFAARVISATTRTVLGTARRRKIGRGI